MYLQPLWFYFNSNKNSKNLIISKTVNLIKKSARNKKDVKFNFMSDMFYEIFCIVNQYRLIAVFIFGNNFPKMAAILYLTIFQTATLFFLEADDVPNTLK